MMNPKIVRAEQKGATSGPTHGSHITRMDGNLPQKDLVESSGDIRMPFPFVTQHTYARHTNQRTISITLLFESANRIVFFHCLNPLSQKTNVKILTLPIIISYLF